MRQRLRCLLMAGMLVPLFLLGIKTALADPMNMVVQVRKTGGSALNGAKICVGNFQNPCANRGVLTKGNGIAVIQMSKAGGVQVTVSHPKYKTQNRVVTFKPGQPSVRFILEPRTAHPPSEEPGDIKIIAMTINGQATHTTNPTVQVGWHTNRPFTRYRLSVNPTTTGSAPPTNVSPRTSGSAFFTIPSPVNGTRYTIDLQVWRGGSTRGTIPILNRPLSHLRQSQFLQLRQNCLRSAVPSPLMHFFSPLRTRAINS